MTGVIGVWTRARSAIDYHGALAPTWEARYRRGGFRRRARFFENRVLPGLYAQGDWIDVGCGTGFFARRLAALGVRVLGIDGSAAMIDVAHALSTQGSSQPGPRYEVRRVEAMSYPDGSFEGAIALSVLEYLDDPAACLAQMARIVKPGGQVVISVPNKPSALRGLQGGARWLAGPFSRGPLEYLATSAHRWRRTELPALAAAAGLRLDRTEPFDPWLPSWLFAVAPPSLLFVVLSKPVQTEGGAP